MNKRGWLRIFEAVLAILLIMGAVLFMYTNQKGEVDEGKYIMDWQDELLSRIAENDSLRNSTINEDVAPITAFVRSNLLPNLNFSVKICNLTGTCPLDFYVGKDVFVRERIISGTLDVYNPKKIRFFVWKN